MPTQCEHGRYIDWGDFGPADSWGQGCEQCGIDARPRCGVCEGQGVIHRFDGSGGWNRWTESPCTACGGAG